MVGFEVVAKKKGTFVDGHEREDVVEFHTKVFRIMIGLGFLMIVMYKLKRQK